MNRTKKRAKKNKREETDERVAGFQVDSRCVFCINHHLHTVGPACGHTQHDRWLLQRERKRERKEGGGREEKEEEHKKKEEMKRKGRRRLRDNNNSNNKKQKQSRIC
jgi:hypothetical protein